ncbi:hypothetical protein BLNAU_5972 [Blattamonas nauphoetae]|uniref:Uncharacterized protein n=1 Tax=Blattamonas nauphoetae TaxID=2049346 RepID=A0ABQ9Y5E0_9EUKA|nr:hypothetical protein BLNAU_5972 [Blattamonas nauphoetae]
MAEVSQSSFHASLLSTFSDETEPKVSESSLLSSFYILSDFEGTHQVPTQLMAFPQLLFTDPAHFTIDCSTITHSAIHLPSKQCNDASSIVLGDPITKRTASVTMTIHTLPIPTGTESYNHLVSSVDSERLNNLSPSLHPNSMSKSRSVATASVPSPLVTLPPLLFTDPSHFIINGTSITRSEVDLGIFGFARHSSALLRDPIDNGIVSITLALLSLININDQAGGIRFGLLKSIAPVPKLGEFIGYEVKVQLFVNGRSGRSFVSGLPPSVRIGFSVFAQETSFRIDRIVKQTQPTPILQYIPELHSLHFPRWNRRPFLRQSKDRPRNYRRCLKSMKMCGSPANEVEHATMSGKGLMDVLSPRKHGKTTMDDWHKPTLNNPDNGI